MAVTQQDIDHFHEFASEHLNQSGGGLTMQQIVEKWQEQRARAECNKAIREGLADANAGRVYDAADVLQEMRQLVEVR